MPKSGGIFHLLIVWKILKSALLPAPSLATGILYKKRIHKKRITIPFLYKIPVAREKEISGFVFFSISYEWIGLFLGIIIISDSKNQYETRK
ncbi:Uncharacterized protein dnm_023680 [Desulfonema magnum]|uniref:Uncharacterized protein n=1 Tax=Desulfonema magnum TaxID=45655 RepID=A0A975BJ75_9BACT|nr:Uncharacterized protein dnm_023680 [Desulfonema magnum]